MRPLYDRNFAIAFGSQVLFVFANTLLAHYARWIGYLGGTERDIGWIMGVAPTISLLFRPVVGQWIDRLGVRTSWAIGQALLLIAAPANLLCDGLGAGIYVLRTMMTLGVAIVSASSLTYIAEIAPPHRRTEAIGVFGASGFVGMFLGPALGDLLLNGVDRSWWTFAGYFGAVTFAVAGSTLLLAIVRPTTNNNAEQIPIGLVQFTRTALRHWPGMVLLVNVMFGVCMTVPFGFLAKYIDHEKLSPTGVGAFFFVYAGWALILRVVLRDLPDRYGRRKVLLAGLILFGVGSFTFAWVDVGHAWRLIVPALLCGAGHSLMFHTMVSLAIERFPGHLRGTGSVLALMHLDMGQIAGAPLLGEIAFLFGFDRLFEAVGVGCLIVAGIYAWSFLIVGTGQPRPGRHLANVLDRAA